eukprot:6201141-Pleurochrysis_carterae.AAC.1
MYADQCAWLEPGFGDSNPGFNGEGMTTKGHDGHDRRFVPSEQLIGRALRTRRAAGAVEHVDGVLDGVVPEGGGGGGGGEIGSRQLHGGADCPLRHAIERVDVWRRGGGVHRVVGEELREIP